MYFSKLYNRYEKNQNWREVCSAEINKSAKYEAADALKDCFSA